MRTIVAVGLAVVMLFIGIQALGLEAGNTQDAAVDNGTNESAAAWNMTTGIYSGLGQTYAPALVFMGIGAVVLVALGILVSVGGGR